MKIDLSGKNVFVCGSTSGIGKASAIQLAESGATVTLISRNKGSLIGTCDSLNSGQNQKHDYICVDFSNPESLKKKVDDYLTREKTIHILVNNTSGPPPGQAIDAKISEFTQTFSNHLLCNQILTQAVVPGMKSKGYGRIINIISTSVKQPISGLGVSNTIRGAVASWSKTLSSELGPFGITVNNILPGTTNTGRLQSLLEMMAQTKGITKVELTEIWKNEIPADRIAEPEEIAYAVTFLASPLASYINGINLPVDGGRLKCL